MDVYFFPKVVAFGKPLAWPYVKARGMPKSTPGLFFDLNRLIYFICLLCCGLLKAV
jgi:hypothetical protein